MTLAKTAKQIAADPEAQYQALQRSLRRRKGFGLLFIQASPAKAQELLQRLQKDLPQKTIGTLTLTEPITNLYNLVAERPDLADLNILFIQGIEKSLEADIKPGYGGEGDYYNIDTVPPLLSHLNQQRDNFRDHFGHLCFVFVVPPFALKYLIRRAADFLDWQSAIFTFADAQGFLGNDENYIIEVIRGSAGNDTISGDDLIYGDSGDDLIYGDSGDDLIYGDIEIIHGSAGNDTISGDDLIYGDEENNIVKDDVPDDITSSSPKLSEDLILGNKSFVSAQYESTIAACDQALALKPDNHEALILKGIALFNLGQYEAAMAAYDQALPLKPNNYEALILKGMTLRHLGQYEAAIAAYDQALAIKPDNHEALILKGYLFLLLGRHEAVIEICNQALAIKPDDHEAFYCKGLALGKLRQYEVALAAYDQALAINPDLPDVLYDKACCYGLQGNVENAIDCLQKAIALEPECRAMAKTDTDFATIRHDERFRALVEGESLLHDHAGAKDTPNA